MNAQAAPMDHVLQWIGKLLLAVVLLGASIWLALQIVPAAIELILVVAGLGLVGWVGMRTFRSLKRYGELAEEEHALRRKLAAKDLDELVAADLKKRPADLVADGQPDWDGVRSYVRGLVDLGSFLSGEYPADVRASLDRKSRPLLVQLQKDIGELKERLREDTALREKAALQGETERVQAEAAKAKAEESTARLNLEREKAQKARAEKERKVAEAKVRLAELERERKRGAFTLSEHLSGLHQLLAEVKEGEMSETEEARLLAGYRRLREQLGRLSVVPLEERDAIAPDDLRTVQVRALLRRYAEEISRVESDDRIDPVLKEVLVGVWKGLMDQDVMGIQGGKEQ